MKGMKKPLALALTLLMAFSLLSVGSLAAKKPVPVEEVVDAVIVEEEAKETPVSGTPIPARPDVEPEDKGEPTEDADWEDQAVLLDGEEGLTAETGTVEYREGGNSPEYLPNLPGTLSSGTYKLLKNLSGGSKVVVASGVTATLDLNGKTYNSSGRFVLTGGTFTLTDTSATPGTVETTDWAFEMSEGGGSKATVTGGVTIKSGDGVGVYSGNNTFTLENGAIKSDCNGVWINSGKTDAPNSGNKIVIGTKGVIECPNDWAIGLWGTNNTLEVSGKVSAKSFAIFTNGQPNNGKNTAWSEDITIKVHDGANITATDTTAPAMYLPGTGECIIDGGTISGPMAIHTKTAALTISGGTLTGTGPHVEWVHNSGGSSGGGNAVMVEKSAGYRPESFAVSITGGTFISENSAPVASYSYEQEVDPSKFITGGTFKGAVAMDTALVADNCALAASGNVVPNESTTKTPDYVVEWTKADNSKVYLATLPNELTEGTYKLLADVNPPKITRVKGGDNNVTLDLGAYTLERDSSTGGNTGVIIESGNSVEIKGSGTLKATAYPLYIDAKNVNVRFGAKIESGDRGVNIASTSENVTFTLSEGAEIKATDTGITAFGTGNTVNVYGAITTRTSFALCTNGQTNNGTNEWWSDDITFNVGEGAKLTSDTIAVYLPGGGEFKMTGGEITGTTGIYNKCAKLNISGGTVTGNGGREEYQFYNNGCYNTGDAVAIDNCGYPHGDPVVSITGGTFVSAKGSAIGSYYFTEKKDAPIKGFIMGACADNDATFTGVLPVNADLVESGYRIVITNGVGKVVASAVTVTATVNEDKTVTYTVKDTDDSTSDITVTAKTEAETEEQTAALEETDVSKQIADLDKTIDMAGLLSEGTLPTEDTDITFTMASTVNAGKTTETDNKKTTTIDIQPMYKIGDGTEQKLDNSFIKAPIKVNLPKYKAKDGWAITAVWHFISATVKQNVPFTYSDTDGLSFSLSSFSDIQVEEAPTDAAGKPMFEYTLSLEEAVPHNNANKDSGPYNEYKKTGDAITYNIKLTSNLAQNSAKNNEDKVSAINFTLNTDGLTVSNIAINGSDSSKTPFDVIENSAGTNQIAYAFNNKEEGTTASAKDIKVDSSGTVIGTVTFAFPGGAKPGDQYDISLTDVSVKARILGKEQTPNVEAAIAKVELDPEYTIHVVNPAYIKAGETTTTASAEVGTGYTYTILTGYNDGTNDDAALPVPSIGPGYKFVGYKVTKVEDTSATAWTKGNWELTSVTASNPYTNPVDGTKYFDFAYTVNDEDVVTADELRTELAKHAKYGDVQLEAVYEVQLYTLKIKTPPAKNTPDNGVINQATDATFTDYTTSYKYDINGKVYDSTGAELTDGKTPATTLTNIPEVTRAYYDFDAFVAFTKSADGEGNWDEYESVALKDDETPKAFPKGKWGDITLNATYKATVYTITLKNPAVDDTTKVIKTGTAAAVADIVFVKDSASKSTVNYTVEGYTTGYAYNHTGDKTEAVIPYDPFLKHYDFSNTYTVTADAKVGETTGWTKNATVNVGAGSKVGAGKFGNVTLRADYTAHKYTAKYAPNTSASVVEAFTFTAITDSGITYDTDNHEFQYTIEDGVNTAAAKIFGVPTRPAYTFAGWTITKAEKYYDNAKETGYSNTTADGVVNQDFGGWVVNVDVDVDDLSKEHSTPTETPQLVWGDVTLKSNWTLNGVLKTFGYKYAKSGDLLALFAIKKNASEAGTYTYAAGSDTAANMFIVSDQYKALFTEKLPGESTAISAMSDDGVVIYGYIGKGHQASDATGKLAVIAYKADGDGAEENAEIHYDGDMTGNLAKGATGFAVNAGDYGNVTAMLANPDQYEYSQVSVASRLAADVYNKGAGGDETTKWFASIKDAKFIMNATVGITDPTKNPDHDTTSASGG